MRYAYTSNFWDFFKYLWLSFFNSSDSFEAEILNICKNLFEEQGYGRYVKQMYCLTKGKQIGMLYQHPEEMKNFKDTR